MDGTEPSLILASRSEQRRKFAAAALARFGRDIPAGPVLVKPNVVSHEAYPTTTHPDMLDEVLALLSGRAITVADGPGADLLRPGKVLRDHELARVCERRGLELQNVYEAAMTKIEGLDGASLAVSALPEKFAALISLPVLKSHKICMMTGALKNHFGFFSRKQRGLLHFGRGDIHMAIASVCGAYPPSLVMVDAVVTSINGNEARHGGEPRELGCLFAGVDPVALDVFGLSLLGEVEPRLAGVAAEDIAYIKYAASAGVGRLDYRVEWIEP